jgi:hypothetical protein
VTILRELHDELDGAVAAAYGWPVDLPGEKILSRLVALNAERVEEEKQGKIRWLRPEYQTKPKAERKAIQATLDLAIPAAPAPKGKKSKSAKADTRQVWPSDILKQTQKVRDVVDAFLVAGKSITPDAVAAEFLRAPRARVQEVLQALVTLGFVIVPESKENIT